MSYKKIISAIAALGIIVSLFTGVTLVSAEDTETVYNFSSLTGEYNKNGEAVFDGALTVSGGETVKPVALAAAVLTPLGKTENITSALITKRLAVKVHLKAGETVVEYYCGSDSKATSAKALDFVVKDASGTVVASEANAEEKDSVKPYVIYYKAETEGDYTIVDNGTTSNRTIVYAVAVTNGEYTSSGGNVPQPSPTAAPDDDYDFSVSANFKDNSTISANVTYNGSGSMPEASLVAATYNTKGKLINAAVFALDSAGSKELNYEKPASGSVKMFIWNGMSEMKPLGAVVNVLGSTPTPVPTGTSSPTPTPVKSAEPVDPNTVSNITNVQSTGWLETAYVTWQNSAPVDKYNVYVRPEGGEYTKIDDALVRYYGSYYRADAPGLKAGRYQMKIEPIIAGNAQAASESEVVEVQAQIREGYAFDPKSAHYNPDGVGAYKNDGTLKDGAQVIYVTDANKDTITHTVMVGGKPNVGTGLVDILALREKNNAETTPLAIRLIGQIESPAGKNSSGYVQVKSASNITVEGIGNDAGTYHWSLLLRQAENVEVKNLAVMEFYDDGISLDTKNYNCWIHNCDIFYGQNRGGDQKKGDGSLDVKSGSDYCTFSYNHFWDSGKSSLCGMKDDSFKGYHITYHHNWFDHSDSRHPRVRGDIVHVYNNYYDGNSKYGIGSCTGSNVFVENNVFRNCLHPVLISLQGTDGLGDGTFSGESGGNIKMYGNEIWGGISPIYASETNKTDYDAYLAASREEQVPADYVSKSDGTTYKNFDTASDMYKYTPTKTEDVVVDVKSYAGRIEGGDFIYTFNNATDDSNYDRNEVLGKKLEDYRTTLKREYVTSAGYPAATGNLPTKRGTIEGLGEADKTTPSAAGTPSGGGVNSSAVIWRASDTAKGVEANTVLMDSWLTLIGGKLDYADSKKSVGGVSFTGKMNAPSGQTAPTIGNNGQDGAALKLTAIADGTVKFYIKLNSGKTFYITNEEGYTQNSMENATASSVYTTLSAEVTKGTSYYAFGGGTNVEFWGVEYVSDAFAGDSGDE